MDRPSPNTVLMARYRSPAKTLERLEEPVDVRRGHQRPRVGN